MNPRRVQQRQRILRARSVAERIAQADHLVATDARLEAAALARRLAHEVALIGGARGLTDGQMLSARAALAQRLAHAVGSMAAREVALSAGETLAAHRVANARLARRTAETLVERAESAASVASDRRFAVPHRRSADRLP